MAEYKLTLPVENKDVEKLVLGDTVYLNGIVFTARDMAHLEIRKLIDSNKPLPEDLKGSAIFHAGPVCLRDGDGWKMNVIGPTTSIRMEPHADLVGKLGIKIIIGKGGLAKDSLEAFKKYKQVYLQAAPGCAVKIAAGVKAVKNVHWFENGMPEAMWVLDVENFGPFIVTMDSHGHSRYDDVKKHADEVIANSKILKV
ncbi:MAG: FumA C-terminus/TtdB family hydratase beta subunit [Campylobacteraceae bacterium]